MRTSDGIDVTAALSWASEVVGPIAAVGEVTGGRTSTLLSLTAVDGARAILRLMTREPWRTHGVGLTTREHEIQGMLTGTAVPAPRSLALDADGRHCGHPAHLMSLLPGQTQAGRLDADSLGRLAELLATVHDVVPTIDVRRYQSWAWEAKYVVPPWATDTATWERAFALLRTDPPAHADCFLHRDFQPFNVLWSGGRISGVVDWVETSIGPAWLDVAHCRTNLALLGGNGPAEAFAAAYVDRTGRKPQPYFDVMDIVGFLPAPGRATFVTDAVEQARLETWLGSVLRRLDREPG
jgi:aminoglycoside phosphotransferase (APT) family kinase protein